MIEGTPPGTLAERVTKSMDPDVAAGQTAADKRAQLVEWKRQGQEARRFLAMNPKWRMWLAEPYTRYAKRHITNYENTVHINEALQAVGCPSDLQATARKMLMEGASIRSDAPTLRRHIPDRATPAVRRTDPYRSQYERRLAAALKRLGIRFRYEAATFAYQDAKGNHHRYTPDFSLDDLHQTYVEVKGIQGADAADNVKMWHVLRQNSITLLLWDASIIEMVEDMQHASEVMGLLPRTRLAA